MRESTAWFKDELHIYAKFQLDNFRIAQDVELKKIVFLFFRIGLLLYSTFHKIRSIVRTNVRYF